MRIAFWNLNWRTNAVARADKIALLDDIAADFFLVAECDPPTYDALSAAFGAGGHGFGLEGLPPGPKSMGSAVLVARGTLHRAEPVEGLPRPERGVVADVEVDGTRFSVLAWHAPHAVGPGPDRMVAEMAAYRTVIDSSTPIRVPSSSAAT